MFAQLTPPPEDPILGLARLVDQDASDAKVDLGIGVYKDAQGKVPVMASVKRAEAWLLGTQKTKGYLSSVGNPEFNRLAGELLFGADSAALRRSRTMQTPGGTAALRVAGDFLRKVRSQTRIFVPTPTWANHQGLFSAAGHQVISYPYYDVSRGELQFDATLQTLDTMTADDVLLLHGCCHNPSGADPNLEQWREIATRLERTGALPLIDLAYQGFGVGLREDASALDLLASRLPELLIASSYSKNFGLYRERIGSLTFLGSGEADAVNARGHAQMVARTNYSMPPDHGAAVVARILSDAQSRDEWRDELRGMRERITSMRIRLAEGLQAHGMSNARRLAHQRGMFALLDISADAVEALRTHHHVHITSSGRINIAGLTPGNVERVAAAIAAVAPRQ
jgi:aspartate/tyrosine/aromatic aminotransferase